MTHYLLLSAAPSIIPESSPPETTERTCFQPVLTWRSRGIVPIDVGFFKLIRSTTPVYINTWNGPRISYLLLFMLIGCQGFSRIRNVFGSHAVYLNVLGNCLAYVSTFSHDAFCFAFCLSENILLLIIYYTLYVIYTYYINMYFNI